MGDESAPAPSRGAATQQSTQDLLADIFGTSNDEARPAAAAGKSSVNDILGLFGSTSLSSPQSNSPAPSPSMYTPSTQADLFSSAPAAPAPAPAAPPALETATAYEANGLKITLTPAKDAARPNVVNVLARFTSTNGETIEGVNFQAAVPKVRLPPLRLVTR